MTRPRRLRLLRRLAVLAQQLADATAQLVRFLR